mmetsp:Transcript_18351/g.34626  ORF Transcript_18351/g.34626 Transcript_18351/m.34626 type:complete len:216 (-) Transcript_18351:797-1444(-)
MACHLNQASRTQIRSPHPGHTSPYTYSSPHQASLVAHPLSQVHCQLCKSIACRLHRQGHHHCQTRCPHPGQTSCCTWSSPQPASSLTHPLSQGHCQMCQSMACHLNQASRTQSQTHRPDPHRTSLCTCSSAHRVSFLAHPWLQGQCQTCTSMACHLNQASRTQSQTHCPHPRHTSPCTMSSPLQASALAHPLSQHQCQLCTSKACHPHQPSLHHS